VNETRWAVAEGTRLAFDVAGEGPPLTFLHAGIADRTMWEPQVAALADGHRCIAYDLRGFGESAIGTVEFSRRDDLAAVLDAVGVAASHIVGCSIGAAMALDFAIERPERVHRLVLVGVTPAGFDAPDPILDQFMAAVDEAEKKGDFDDAARLEVRAWVDGPRRAEGSAPQWLRDKVRKWILPTYKVEGWGLSRLLDPPAMERLGEVRAPTLVIVGTEDADAIIAGCEATAAGIPDATLVRIEGSAHLPNLEAAGQFNDALVQFLND
jgi:pimeloyl-ACP methyl ester carboxylesterase